MKSDGDELDIQIVDFVEIYNFIVLSFSLRLLKC